MRGNLPVERLQARSEPLDVGAAAREQLAAEARVEPRAAHDVGHERVAGDQPTAREREAERAQVDRVTRPRRPERELARGRGGQPALALALERPGLVRE